MAAVVVDSVPALILLEVSQLRSNQYLGLLVLNRPPLQFFFRYAFRSSEPLKLVTSRGCTYLLYILRTYSLMEVLFPYVLTPRSGREG